MLPLLTTCIRETPVAPEREYGCDESCKDDMMLFHEMPSSLLRYTVPLAVTRNTVCTRYQRLATRDGGDARRVLGSRTVVEVHATCTTVASMMVYSLTHDHTINGVAC